jgi:ribonucleoside-diphosphate reductase alpha chain
VNPNDKNIKISFTDEVGDSWEEFNVFHHKFLTWLEVIGFNTEEVKNYSEKELKALVEKSPYHKATSSDVDWVSKVKMQGMIQKWVDHSISVTVNLPANVSEEMVANVYQTAWESGCKGCTVYREGSRDGVLISSTKKDEAVEIERPGKRPPVLECDVIRFKNNHENWIAFVGLFNEKPYEIFTGISEDDVLPIPKAVKKGSILKTKDSNGSRYDFQYVDKFGYTNTIGGLSHMFNKEFWNYAKLISGILRHGMPIPFVVHLVDNLQLETESINTWKNGVVRALKRYIPDGTKIAKETCPNCGEKDTLEYREGCVMCTSCGDSKCG